MFKARFGLRISANHVTLIPGDGGQPIVGRPDKPFSYGGKLVADREALTELLQSVFRLAGSRGLGRLLLWPVVDVEATVLVGDDEAAIRAALETVGVSTIHVTVT